MKKKAKQNRSGDYLPPPPQKKALIIAYQSYNNKNDLGLHPGRSRGQTYGYIGTKSLGILINYCLMESL